MQLEAKADKASQIDAINRLLYVVQCIAAYIDLDGEINDEAAEVITKAAFGLEGVTMPNAPAAKPKPAANPSRTTVATVPDSGAPFLIKAGMPAAPPPPPKKGACDCKIGILDKKSATTLCLMCGGNAAANYHVFNDTEEGKAILRGEDPLIENMQMPNPFEEAKAAAEVQAPAPVAAAAAPAPEVFQPFAMPFSLDDLPVSED